MGGPRVEAPDYARATKEGIETEIEMLPQRYDTELEYRPLFDALERESQKAGYSDWLEFLTGGGTPEYTVGQLFAQDNDLRIAYDAYRKSIPNDVIFKLDALGKRPELAVERTPQSDRFGRGMVDKVTYFIDGKPIYAANDQQAQELIAAEQKKWDAAYNELKSAAPEIPLTQEEFAQKYIADNPDSRAAKYVEQLGPKKGLLERTYELDAEWRPKYAEQDLKIAEDTARRMAEVELAIEKELGPEFAKVATDILKQVDPQWFAVRDMLGGQVEEELAKGGDLTEGQARRVQQSARGASSARGNVLGPAAAAQEVLSEFLAGEELAQQRKGNAAAFLAGQQPVNQFGAMQGAQGGAAPFNPMSQPRVNSGAPGGFVSGAGTVMDPNAGDKGRQWTQQNYQMEAQQAMSRGNPWVQALGLGLSAAGAAGGLGWQPFCWVARAIYGEHNMRWRLARSWMLNAAPCAVRALYCRFGPWLARFMEGHRVAGGLLKKLLRPVFDRMVRAALDEVAVELGIA